MAKVNRVRRLKRRCPSDKVDRYRMQSCSHKIFKDMKKNACKLSEKKDWEDATCSVCMEPPHNAVLLLCSSYNKGCRPYMCATNDRFSNCLDQYKKAYTKATSGSPTSALTTLNDKAGAASELLLCPLCRGEVKGWTLVEPARKHLNKKKRGCMEENCSFVGTYKQLKKHVKSEHPLARPRKVDPTLEEEWKRLERERERDDVLSTLAPGTIIVGDYVLDPFPNLNRFLGDFNMGLGMEDDDDDEDEDDDDGLEIYGGSRFRGGGFQLHRPSRISFGSFGVDDDDDDDHDDEMEVVRGRHPAFSRDVGGNARLPFNRHDRRVMIFSRPHQQRQRWRNG